MTKIKLTDEERETLLRGYRGNIVDNEAAVESIVAAYVAEALRDAADRVKDVRENGLKPGMDSHPYATHFESWLRALAAEYDPQRADA